ncbi:acetoacetate decarboxylase family protein [Anaeromyxobacter oryzae]|uniref:Acetoacetate decarboxylase n=1 Tax=Anaeromyxobacter oryzae TaxID=2918170 RepID=A0ABM7WP28_9BACT|nr:acetoacetate decarboxylase family protein [Anaeromyxobacter oryzae]BDG01227.1 hypothetical protein AMOR_02230 [Anaeromyxobacter oryzae]
MTAFFQGVKQTQITAGGFTGPLPIFYYDSTAMVAAFTASTAKVAPLVPDPDLHPVELRPGRCLVNVAALEHRRTDIGPYAEVIVSAMVAFGRRPLPLLHAAGQLLRHALHGYVLHLPVTTEPARAGGVEVYGYPKFIADVTFTRSQDRFTCSVSDAGRRILTLDGEYLKLYGTGRSHVKLYSMKDGRLLCAPVEMNSRQHAQTLRRHAARLDLGSEHGMARDLAALELEPHAVVYQLDPVLEIILYAPHPAREPLGRVGT